MAVNKVRRLITHKISFTCIIFLILCCQLSKSIKSNGHPNNRTNVVLKSYQNNTLNNYQHSRINSTIKTRQGRDQKYKGYFNPPTGQVGYSNPTGQVGYSNPTGQSGYYPPPPSSYYGYGGSQYNDMNSNLESPLANMEPDYGDGEDDGAKSPDPEEEVTPEANDDEDDGEEEEKAEATTAAPETTTTLAPFTLADVKVPAPFLRIEYMISFTFFGVMYGLGFFVLFQSLCVPAAKIAVYIVYMILLKLGSVDPVTLEQALEQLPPT